MADVEYHKEKDRLIEILSKHDLLLDLLDFVNKKKEAFAPPLRHFYYIR